MAEPIVISVQPEPGMSHYDCSLALDGRRYPFAFYTCTADDRWYFDIVGAVHGIGIASGVDLLYPYRYLGDVIPPGFLYVRDRGLRGRDPSIDSFEKKLCALYYLPVGAP
jgi:hypothetical protein